jgi:hypothetical protein
MAANEPRKNRANFGVVFISVFVIERDPYRIVSKQGRGSFSEEIPVADLQVFAFSPSSANFELCREWHISLHM